MRRLIKNPRLWSVFSGHFPSVFFLVGVVACSLFFTASASATPINMFVYEGEDVPGLNLWADISDGGSYATFTFHNDSTISSVITSIYIESTSFSSGAYENGQIVNPQPTGVDFSSGATPPKPAGSIKNFGGEWTGNLFSADAENPSPQWGINPGESLSIKFDYKNGTTHGDILQSLMEPGFRIVQHVQADDGSSSVWTTNVPHAPLPSTLVIMLAGLAGLFKRKF